MNRRFDLRGWRSAIAATVAVFANIALLCMLVLATVHLLTDRLSPTEPELLVVEKSYPEYIPVPEPVKVEVPVTVTKYVEVPATEAVRTERYASIPVSAEDRELMARLAWREARGEKILGMRMVLEVVLNRVLSPYFPNTVKEVLYQPGHFAPAQGVPELEEITPGPDQYEAVDLVLTETPITDEDVVFFARTPIYGEIFMEVGGHVFCRMYED